MTKNRRRTSKGHRHEDRFTARREWVGGRLSPPFFVQDPEEPFRTDIAVWMELPSGVIVAHELLQPRGRDGAVARGLLAAMQRPMAGPPRRPHAIRVAEEALATEVRDAVGDTIPVVVAPTPELDELLELMTETMPDGMLEPTYLENGRLSPEMLREFFEAARLLYLMAPWKVAADNQVLRLDIPALGVDGACVSIIGNLGHSPGVIVFPSFAGYEAFLQAAEAPRPRTGRFDLGTGWLALSLVPEEELPESMLREVADHEWPVEANTYPLLERRDPDGASRPLVERDLEIATASANSLCTFFLKHSGMFEGDEFEPVCESYFDGNDREVRFTAPYEAFSLFDVGEREPRVEAFRPRAARNAPCPCGSGRKYKKCHLPIDEREHAAGGARQARHDLDARMVGALSDYADGRFGDEWRRFVRDFEDPVDAAQIALPWSVYGFSVRGRTVLEWYLEGPGKSASPAERAWLEAQQASWLSIWEVIDVEPGKSMTLHDLLTDERRRIEEDSGSRTVVVRDTLLGRVIDHGEISLLRGAHPQPLRPLDAAEVVRRVRGRLRRKRAVPAERLRDPAIGRYLIRRWEEAVAGLERRAAVPPDIRNTDGDALLLTIDRFEIAPGARPVVEAAIAGLEGVRGPGPDDDPGIYAFLRPAEDRREMHESTLIGRALLSGKLLRLETNSRERAELLRKQVEEACGDRIRFKIREHVDPLSSAVRDEVGRHPPEPTSPELQQVALEYKRRHYADWIDHALPALEGKTPREAARTRSGRDAVDVLLKEMERHERRLPRGEAFDFSGIRGELGLG